MNDTLGWIYARCVEDGDCLLWQGALARGGVPQMQYGGKVRPVRRVVAQLLGKKLDGLLATTTCGNPLCLAKEHLWMATRQQLQQYTADRTGYGRSLTRRARISRAKRAQAKLSLDQVEAIRLAPSAAEAARAHGIARSTAISIRAHKMWRNYGNNPWEGMGARV